MQSSIAHEQSLRALQNYCQYWCFAIEKVAHNIAKRIKDFRQKFSGYLGQCWQKFVDEYKQIARNFGLNEHQKLSYLHNLLSKDAHRYYLGKVKLHVTLYSDTVETIEKGFLVQQTKFKNHLSNSRNSSYITSEADSAYALTLLYKFNLIISR